MCDFKKDLLFNCDGQILDTGNGEFKIKGKIDKYKNVNLQWWAASPPNYLTSFSGSGLPYPNPIVAYNNTPNKGIIKTDFEGNFEFNVFVKLPFSLFNLFMILLFSFFNSFISFNLNSSFNL